MNRIDRHTRPRPVFPVGLIFIATFFLSSGGQAQDFCDRNLEIRQQDPLSYGPRGDRCEGRYIEPTSATLEFASFHVGTRTFDPTEGVVFLTWPTHAAGETYLRVDSVKHGTYYRMDTVRAAEGTSFEWPSELLSSLGLVGSNLGYLSWTRRTIAGRDRKVYAPVSVGGSSGTFEVVLWPTAEMAEIYVTLTSLDDSGRDLREIMYQEPLDYGYYPELQPIVFELAEAAPGEDYRLNISGEAVSGLPLSIERYLVAQSP